jgi:hypothetical protein
MGKKTQHLWEIEHPYYAPDGHETYCESFTEMKESFDALDSDLNFIYRWDWEDDRLTVHFLMPRRNTFANHSCPIAQEQESEVLEWLRAPRVLGALKTMWEGVL